MHVHNTDNDGQTADRAYTVRSEAVYLMDVAPCSQWADDARPLLDWALLQYHIGPISSLIGPTELHWCSIQDAIQCILRSSRRYSPSYQ